MPDYAELDRLAHVSRARISQIMSLTLLAPDTQEAILFLPPTNGRRAPIGERQVRPIAAVLDWREQRRTWGQLVGSRDSGGAAVERCLPAEPPDPQPMVRDLSEGAE